MRRILIRGIKILAVLLPVCLMVFLDPASGWDERCKIRNFYREGTDTLDVVLLGSSEVFTGYSAPLAYEEFGFTSYPYGMSSNHMDFYSSQMEEICREQDPELIVIEITPGMYAQAPENMDARFRQYISRTPLSMNKLRSIQAHGDQTQWLSYCVPFVMYHNTIGLESYIDAAKEEWSFWKRGYSLLKSSTTATGQYFPGGLLEVPDRPRALSGYTETCLRNFLEYCKEKQYDNLLFVTFPHRVCKPEQYDRSLRAQTAAAMIESYGYPYINLERHSGQIGLDAKGDYYNDDHLNLYGQKKLTSYLGKILVEDYGIGKSRLSPKDIARWETSLDYTHRFMAFFEEEYRKNPENPGLLYEKKSIMDTLEQMGPVS